MENAASSPCAIEDPSLELVLPQALWNAKRSVTLHPRRHDTRTRVPARRGSHAALHRFPSDRQFRTARVMLH